MGKRHIRHCENGGEVRVRSVAADVEAKHRVEFVIIAIIILIV